MQFSGSWEANGALTILAIMGGGIVKIEWYDAAQFLGANDGVSIRNPTRRKPLARIFSHRASFMTQRGLTRTI
jgi:hypothetical protein